MALTPKTQVRARYPGAWSIDSAQAREWVIMSGTKPEKRLGSGRSPAAAWKAAANNIAFAEGIAKMRNV